MEIRAGDIIKLKDDLRTDKFYSAGYCREMKKGSYEFVVEVFSHSFRIKSDNIYVYSADMVERVVQRTKIKNGGI